MPDKLTDSEIVKALKGAILNAKGYDSKVWSIEVYKLEYALDLINRLQAENESLKRQLHNAKLHQKETRKALQDEKSLRLNEDFIKAEAYKEFAENSVERVEKARQKYQRLCKEQGEEMEEYMHIHFNVIIGIINNLLKELVGEDNGEEKE